MLHSSPLLQSSSPSTLPFATEMVPHSQASALPGTSLYRIRWILFDQGQQVYLCATYVPGALDQKVYALWLVA